MWRTWANLLTLLRLASAVPCAVAIAAGYWAVSAALFGLAVVTDLADGPLARRRGQASRLGGVLDHSTDATFVALALAALAVEGFVPWPLPLLVAAAFVQYLLDSRALSGHALRTSWLGRVNGIAYFVLAGVPIVGRGLGLEWPPPAWVLAAGWLLVLTTLLSMGDRAVTLLRVAGGGRTE